MTDLSPEARTPIEPGFYWAQVELRPGRWRVPEIVEVFEDRAQRVGDPKAWPLSYFTFLSGPLAPPQSVGEG